MSRPSATRQRLNDGHPLASRRRSPAVFLLSIFGSMAGLILGILTVSCSAPLENQALQAEEVSVEPVDAVVIGVGKQLQLRATPRNGRGNPVSGYSISWTTSDENVATITQSGLVTAVAEGTATIEATANRNRRSHGNPDTGSETAPGQLKKTATVQVDSTQVASVEVAPRSAEIGVGGRVGLTALVKDREGNSLHGRYVAWSASDETVATVNQVGSVRGEREGRATISAESEGRSGTSSISVSSMVPPSGNLIPAFLGAEGHGATALNACRSLPLQVLTVTNTNDAGAGSWRQALARARSDRFTFIIFRTGGAVTASAPSAIKTSCLYVAGQTAPGDGFGINEPSGGGVLDVWYKDGSRRDIVVRYLRLRSAESERCGSSTVQVLGGQRMIFDHVSIAYTCDSFFAVTPLTGWDSLTDLTIQNSLLCGGLPKNGTALELTLNETDEPLRRLSIARNYVCHYSHRAPRFATEDTLGIQSMLEAEYVSNLNYNWWGSRAGSVQGGGRVDFVNNLYVTGPAAPDPNQRSYLRFVDYDIASGAYLDSIGSVYMSGNQNAPSGVPTYWDYDLFHMYGSWVTPLPDSLRRGTPLPPPTFPVTLTGIASSLPNDLLPNVGVARLLTCDGDWRTTGVRDALDDRFVRDFHNHTGPTERPTSIAAYGGYPTLDSGTPCTDSDQDGMPDAFEIRYALDPDDPSDNGGDLDGDGYLNIEEYLNGTPPR